MTEIKPIKSESDYRTALAEVERLIALDPDPETVDANRLSVLGILVQEYEREHFPFELPTPVEAIKFRMTELGLRQKDLVSMIGSKSKVSEVLSGRRPLSLNMIRALASGLNIPVDLLVVKAGEAEKALRRSTAQ
jgi:HTH-type transcriptional regulator/antitoxin HigA